MNQQPSQQNNNNGIPAPQQQQQQQRIVLQPLQIHSLTESYRNEIAKASEAGNQTEEGQEHLRRARRIRLILLRFQEQQRLQRQQQQQQGGNSTPPANSVNSTPVPQQLTPVPQQLPAPVSRQQSLQNVTQLQQQQQQQQPTPQQAVNNNNSNSNNSRPMNLSSPALFLSRQGSQSTPQASSLLGQPTQQLQLQRPQQAQQPNASILQLQKIRKILDDFHGRLRAIENTKRSGTLGPEELARLVQQEELLKLRYDQYTRAAVQMSQQIQLRRAQLAAAGGSLASSPALQQQPLLLAGSPGGQSIIQQQQQQQARAQIQRNNSQQGSLNAQTLQLQQLQILLIRQQQAAAAARSALQSPVGQQTQQQQQPQQQVQKKQTPEIPAQVNNTNLANRLVPQSSQPQRTPASATGRSASPPQSSTPVTSVNALARPSAAAHGGSGLGTTAAASVVKSPVPSIPISSTINVQAPAPTTMKGSRPSALGGGAFNSLALTQPAAYKLPQFEMEGDRVLHKRKLKELVRSIGSDEGDGETVIDGDVEELLLDLADEFVTNVTSFACRLAKHRKVDNIDVKDIQLHLERNWNIRIPGYSSDEIRSTRRFQPTPGHNQKIAGVEIARSVKKDGN